MHTICGLISSRKIFSWLVWQCQLSRYCWNVDLCSSKSSHKLWQQNLASRKLQQTYYIKISFIHTIKSQKTYTSTFEHRGSQTGVNAPLVVHLLIARGAFRVSNRKEKYFIHYSFEIFYTYEFVRTVSGSIESILVFCIFRWFISWT